VADLKGPLGPLPVAPNTSTRDVLERLDEAMIRGRAFQEQRDEFDAHYRAFFDALRGLREGANLCKDPSAARSFVGAREALSQVRASQREFTEAASSIAAARDDGERLSPARQAQIERVLSFAARAEDSAEETARLFREQLTPEIDARECEEKTLRAAASASPAPRYAAPPKGPAPAWVLSVTRREEVPFTINNLDCGSPFVVYLDGTPLGVASANALTSFTSSAGWHSLCLAADGDESACRDRAEGARSFLSEGWWARAQCPR
jgi:hypothetical protein